MATTSRVLANPAVRLVIAGIGVALAGAGWLGAAIAGYLASPRAVSSTAGLPVFEVDGELVSYGAFDAGIAPAVILIGVLVALAGVAVGAARR